MRLIDADALKRCIEMNKTNANPLDYNTKATYAECITMVENMEAIEAEPLVLCYQCKHVTRDWITGNFLCARNRKVEGNIVYGGFLVDKDDYCSFGVKINLEGCP